MSVAPGRASRSPRRVVVAKAEGGRLGLVAAQPLGFCGRELSTSERPWPRLHTEAELEESL